MSHNDYDQEPTTKTVSALWITWEHQRRNRGMAKLVDAEYYEFETHHRGLRRYAVLSWQTIALLIRRRPALLFCQNPSLILAMLCVVYGISTRAQTIVDEHNAGLFPLESRWRLLNAVARFVVRFSSAVIISNHELSEHVHKLGGHPIICPDPIPQLANDPLSMESLQRLTPGRTNLVVVCSWAADEPYETLFEVANELRHGIDMLFTGVPPVWVSEESLPANVKLLGFVPDQDYDALIRQADGLIVLSNRASCLNCGAYEAVAARTPAVLADTTALRTYFPYGFEYTSATKADLSDKIHRLIDNQAVLGQALASTQTSLQRHHVQAIEALRKRFGWPRETSHPAAHQGDP
jgi:glycosyltransferase involved in cell wall biosynthesis